MTGDLADLLADHRPAPDRPRRAREGTALCLSGGGYRAMLFHAGALIRLNETGLLGRLDFVSSVSGGSIAAGALACGWSRLTWADGVATNLDTAVVDPLMQLAGHTIDRPSVLTGALLPFRTIAEQAVRAYRKHLFADMSTRDLPDHPRFVFTATNLQSGALLRISKKYLRDWRVGKVDVPDVPIAVAVAASAAFPPVLSPVRLRIPTGAWSETGDALADPAYRTEMVLSDGGVYDNLGLEPVIKRCSTILVSDGGGQLRPRTRVAVTWARHTARVLSVIDQQVRNLRSRMLIQGYEDGVYQGAYWGIRTPIEQYGTPGALDCPEPSTRLLAQTPTRLKALDVVHRQCLANWGYAVCDAAVRRHVVKDAPKPAFPWPEAAVG
ncbi:patatin-like phospholipase family protein [Micromonospora soli]|uniref:patatin-like phospholipase family protein n=1 Tax=Micromonospora TaxID=1873 RepID=UPI00267291A8|nr:patatin-like phospholipase family protein [Micromonospora sp. NBRC 110009]WKT96904.1 patatin-like phospholipase family protein [Micromonospora sp. NBRC 110009]